MTTATSSSTSASFVAQLYAQFLRRPADAAGVSYWSSLIDSGKVNAAEVSALFMAGDEFQHTIDPVVRLYFAAFGRSPDPAGLAYWVDAIHAGATVAQIGAVFAGAPEFRSLHGAVDDSAFLDLLYQQAFNRVPDPAGKAYFLDLMARGVSRGELVVNFSNAEEMTASLGATIKVVEQYLAVQQASPTVAQLAAGLASAGSVALFIKLYADDGYSGVAVPFLSREGVVADGYIKGATVTMTFIDPVDGVTRTVTRLTDDHGKFDFGDQAGFGDQVQTGGIDISTGAAVNGSFRAIAGSSVINPLTTLVHALIADGKHSAAEAAALVKSSLGIDASVELGSYDPIATLGRPDTSAAAQVIALKVQAVLAQVNTAMGQIGAVLRGAGVAGVDAGANAVIEALAATIDAAGGTIDLAGAGTAAQLLKDAGGIAGASVGQAAFIASVAGDAGVTIGNLNHAIADAASAPGGTAQSHLVAIASVQVAAEVIETGMASGAQAGNLSGSAAATGAAALAVAIEAAAAQVGDVNGDGKADPVLPPAPPQPEPEPEPEPEPAPEPAPGVVFALTIKAGGDAWINAGEAISAAALTAQVTSSTLATLKIVGMKASDNSALEVTAVLNGGRYVFDATQFKDGALTVVATDIYGQIKTSSVTLDTAAPAVAVTSAASAAVIAPVVSGTAEAGATVTAVIAGATYVTTATGGAWSIDTATATVASGVLALVANAANSVSVTAVDVAGNHSALAATQTLTLVIDTAAPEASLFTATATTLGATSNEAGLVGLYADGVLLTDNFAAFTPSGLTQTFTVMPQETVVVASLQVADVALNFAAETRRVMLGIVSNDAIVADSDYDYFMFGFAGNDVITAGAGADVLSGGEGADVLNGGAGYDMLYGGTGADVLNGGTGDDVLEGGAGADVLDGGDGTDVFVFSAVAQVASDSSAAEPDVLHNFDAAKDSVVVNLSAVHTFDASVKGADKHTGTGQAGDIYSVGIAANVNSLFTGDPGSLVIQADSLSAASAILSRVKYNLTGTGNADTIAAGSNDDTINGGAGDDVISGGLGADTLTGGAGADVFVFGSGLESNDTVIDTETQYVTYRDVITDFQTGVDRLRFALTGQHVDVSEFASIGGFSDDSLSGAVGDLFYSAGQGKIYIDANGNHSVGDNVDYVVASANPIAAADIQFDITGTDGNDTLVGGVGGDTFTGGAGNDTITGGSGIDTFNVDAGEDTITHLETKDILNVAAGASAVVGQVLDFSEYTVNNLGTVIMTGGDGGETIVGTSGADRIIGGGGADTLSGGEGADLFVYNNGIESNNESGHSRDTITDFQTGIDRLSFALSGSLVDVSGFQVRVADPQAGNGVIGDGYYQRDSGMIYLDANGNGSFGDAGDYVVSLGRVAAADLQFRISGTQQEDLLVGGVRSDTIFGDNGADVINGGGGGDQLDGGDGIDTLSYTGGAVLQTLQGLQGVVINNTNHTISSETIQSDAGFLSDAGLELALDDLNPLGLAAGSVGYLTDFQMFSFARDTFLNFENLTGSDKTDLIYGGDGDHVITGGGGNDVIFLGEGQNTVMVGTALTGGIDVIHGFGEGDLILSGTIVNQWEWTEYQELSIDVLLSTFSGAIGTVHGLQLGNGRQYIVINNGANTYDGAEDTLIELVGITVSQLGMDNFVSIPV
ncbi:hypothetical protein CR105_13200 [Massilia eurypsychrophila]|uniref:DUF4214 domain-containing protein n=1 Tax=Massilia eurypsychrophila TaxID=1485217 RepID=A0A2G8TED9_9BURK|nr:DUF4214 domain-containing protein [Massilia eurypsychrophila]PIL44417.1 hypothetical protein CR105_13200 [Massilia eurypsychrophila]